MNARRRKELSKALELLNTAYSIIESVKEDEIEAFENLPEGLQQAEQGSKMEEIGFELEDMVGSLEEYTETLDSIISGDY